MSPPSPFPEIQGGGSLLLAWQIKNKRVLVVGGGEVRSLVPNSRAILTDCLRLRLVEY
jgi:siroheme synthase (precorrin-2 oxidase/ferrochelatase)